MVQSLRLHSLSTCTDAVGHHPRLFPSREIGNRTTVHLVNLTPGPSAEWYWPHYAHPPHGFNRDSSDSRLPLYGSAAASGLCRDIQMYQPRPALLQHSSFGLRVGAFSCRAWASSGCPAPRANLGIQNFDEAACFFGMCPARHAAPYFAHSPMFWLPMALGYRGWCRHLHVRVAGHREGFVPDRFKSTPSPHTCMERLHTRDTSHY